MLWLFLGLVTTVGIIAAVKSSSGSAPGSDSGNPKTGPQALSAADKKTLLTELATPPGLMFVEGKGDSTFGLGVLQVPSAVNLAGGPPYAPALPILYAANMAGHAILVAKWNDPAKAPVGVGVMVPVVGGEGALAPPGGSWFIAFQAKEIDSLLKQIGVDTSKISGTGTGNGSGSGTKTLPAPGTKTSAGIPALSKSLVDKSTIGVDVAGSGANGLPEPFHSAVMTAVTNFHLFDGNSPWSDSGSLASNTAVLAQADALAGKGYKVAAQNLYDLARTHGWKPTWDYHPELMDIPDLTPMSFPDGRSLTGLQIEKINEGLDGAWKSPTVGDYPAMKAAADNLTSMGALKAAATIMALAKTVTPIFSVG